MLLRRLLSAVAAAAAVALPVVALPGEPAYAEDATVGATMQGSVNVFKPGTVQISVGDTVTWVHQAGAVHTVTSSSSNWTKDSNLPPSGSTAFTFTAPGRYSYYCKVHGAPSSGMRGNVLVSAPATSTPKPTPTPTATKPPTPRPTLTTSSPRPSSTRTSSEPGSPSASPSPAAGSPTPVPSRSRTPGAPTPSIDASEDPDTITIGGPGLTPPPATGRERGVWVMLACVSILGVGSAQLRTLLATPAGIGAPHPA